MTPLEALRPLVDEINRKSALKIVLPNELCCDGKAPHNVEPPIARAEHLQATLRQLKQDRDEYRRLLLVTEQLIADYEVLAGSVPF